MPVDEDLGGGGPPEPIDRLVIALRAYITRAPKKPKAGAKVAKYEMQAGRAVDWRKYVPRVPPSDWVLVYDCETRMAPDQRLRFGTYQLRYKGQIWERGAFYEPDVGQPGDLAVLRHVMADEEANSDGERVRLLTRTAFVHDVFYGSAYAVGAQIVGFNLPFDLSRLAIRHASARAVTPPRTPQEIEAGAPKKEPNRSTAGGFSLMLSEDWPPVIVKHLSQRSAFIRVAGARRRAEPNAGQDQAEDSGDDTGEEPGAQGGPDRGYFVDVKTLAAALTSKSHSLASLANLLKVPTPKEESDEHGEALTAEYVRYALRDVQTTWECLSWTLDLGPLAKV
jgi:hypothetical protein